MDQTDQKPYFDKAARHILAKAVGAKADFKTARTEAAVILLRQFHSLTEEYKLYPQFRHEGFSVLFGNFGKKGVFINQDGWPSLVEGDKEYEVPLIFDPTTKQFEGTDVDQDVTPMPGQFKPHQSALTVLVSAFINKLMPGRS